MRRQLSDVQVELRSTQVHAEARCTRAKSELDVYVAELDQARTGMGEVEILVKNERDSTHAELIELTSSLATTKSRLQVISQERDAHTSELADARTLLRL